MMKMVLSRTAFHEWHGSLIDGEVITSITGSTFSCVVRDLLNWLQYNVARPETTVVLEVKEYE